MEPDRYLARLMSKIEVDGIDPSMDLDHLCRRPRCVNPDHLEPVSRRENLQRSPITAASRLPNGRPQPPRRSILTPDDIPVIRARLAAGEPRSAVAESFGVCKQAIAAIVYGRTWSNIEAA